MPWKKVGHDDYVSPSGRHWTLAQIRAYLAKKGDKKKALPLSVVKSGLKAAYRRGIEKGRTDERGKLDAMLARFTAMKELNGHTEMFLQEWSETEEKSVLGRGLSALFGYGKPKQPKQEKPQTDDSSSADNTPAEEKPDKPHETREPAKVVSDLLGHNSDVEQTPLSNEGKTPDEIADDVYQLAPNASHVDSFRLTSEGDHPVIDVKFKNGGSYRYHFRADDQDTAQTVWEELSSANHPGIVIWHWLIRGGVPYEKKAWNRFADDVYFEGVILKAWRESDHRRDNKGQFATVASPKEMEGHIQRSGRALFRGVPRPEHAEQFATGNLRSGTGAYGDGVYVGYGHTGIETAHNAAGDEGHVARMTLKPGAKVETWNDAEEAWKRESKDNPKSEFAEIGTGKKYKDSAAAIAAFAKSRGVDALDVQHNQFMNILNPSAAIVEHPGSKEEPPTSASADAKARSLMSRIGEVPHLVKEKVKRYVADKYAGLVHKFGETGARAILGATVLMLPVPVPGASLIPIALANAVLALKHAVSPALAKAVDTGLDVATVKQEAAALVKELYAAMDEDPPEDASDNDTDDADTPIITTGDESDASDAVVLAMLEHAIPALELGEDPEPGLRAILDVATAHETVHKAFREEDHPRDHGKFSEKPGASGDSSGEDTGKTRGAMTVNDVPELHKLRTPIKGPTGAKIVGYEWRSMAGEKYSNREGGLVEAKVSDWESAETSTGTGRKIVHLFFVEGKDGKVTIEGINSARKILGIQETRLKTIAKREAEEQRIRKQANDQSAARMETSASDSAEGAVEAFRKRNTSPLRTAEENERLLSDNTVLEKNGKYYALPTATADFLKRYGWSEVTLHKAFQESDHPRDDHGRFVSKEAIHAAKTDPTKAAELRARVTNPEQRKKLDAALEGKTDLGRTKQGERKQQAEQRRYVSEADKKRADELIRHFADNYSTGKLRRADLHRLVEHLPHMRLADLRRAREALRANLHGDRQKADVVARLVKHAKDQIAEMTPDRKRKNNRANTVIAEVMAHGGIDPDSLKDHIGDVGALEDNIPLSVFRRGGMGLDELAQELASAGHISVPENSTPGEYLLDQIRNRAHTLAADLGKQEEEKLNAYYQALHEAELHHDRSALEEAVRSGEGAGRDQAQEDLLGETRGDAFEPEEVGDTSFDFGANEAAPEATPAPIPAHPLTLAGMHGAQVDRRIAEDRELSQSLAQRNEDEGKPEPVAHSGRMVVTGNTYAHKDAIRAAGGRWDGTKKQWTVPADAKLPPALGKVLTDEDLARYHSITNEWLAASLALQRGENVDPAVLAKFPKLAAKYGVSG